jgi:transcriptional regulator with XRE-family HTH domain
MNFGQNVRLLRKRAALTQVELAERLGISQQYLADIEAGEKPLRTLQLAATVADALGVSIDDLVNNEPEPAEAASVAAK